MKKIYNEIIRRVMAYLGSQDGFSVSGDKVFYETDQVLILLEPALFRFNTKDSISFWFNCTGFLTVKPDPALKNVPAEGFPVVFIERWSFLWNNAFFQYSITNVQMANAITDDVIEKCRSYFIPFCRSVKNYDSMVQFLETYQSNNNTAKFNFNIAIGFALLDDLVKSKYFFEQAEGDREIIKKIAAGYNVQIN